MAGRKNFQVLCAAVMLVNAFLSAFSQILLKKSADKIHQKPLYEYLNWRVLAAYALYVFILLSNAYAYKGIAYRYGSVIGASSYVFLMILSRLILKEKISCRVLAGNGLIILGMAVYSMNLY